MKRLIIAQLGHVDATSALSDRGKIAMAKLAKGLQPLTKGLTVQILSSPAIPAYESALILAEGLHCRDVAMVDCLYSDPGHEPNADATIQAIFASVKTVDALIVVTHREHVYRIQSRLYEKIFGRAYPEKVLSPATAIIISPETKSVSIVS